MLVLFDQGTPLGIRAVLTDHIVKTCREHGWSTLKNGDLLRVAEEAGFEVFVTPDQNLVHQQSLAGRRLAIVVLGKNRWKLIQPCLAEIARVVGESKPGSFTVIEISDR